MDCSCLSAKIERSHVIKRQSIEPMIRSQLTKKEYVLLKAILLCNPGKTLEKDGLTRTIARKLSTFLSFEQVGK